jgi:hypothetical protein
VKQNVIDPLANGKSHGPRQAISLLKTVIPSGLPSVDMGEDRQEFSRIVTDMSGQNMEFETAQAVGGVASIGMEQVQYQSGNLLAPAETPASFEQYAALQNEACGEQDVTDLMNKWPPTGMDFSVGFEPFDFDNYTLSI